MTKAEIRQAIISHLRKTGSCPNYDTVGGYDAAKPVFDAMRADGTLVWTKQRSPKGRNMTVVRLAQEG